MIEGRTHEKWKEMIRETHVSYTMDDGFDEVWDKTKPKDQT